MKTRDEDGQELEVIARPTTDGERLELWITSDDFRISSRFSLTAEDAKTLEREIERFIVRNGGYP